jgi:type IV pilus assembly protein PilC
MPDYKTFAWYGRSVSGEALSGEREAPSEAALRWLLEQEGIQLTRAMAGKEKKSVSRRISTREKALVMRQLATLIKAGVPILQALEVIREGMENAAIQTLLADLEGKLQGGQALAAAMSVHPNHFDALACRMVAAGELAGALDVMLERVADHQERMLALRGKVRTALFYPATVLVMAVALTLALLVFVVPIFSGMYAQSKVALPVPTQIVIGASRFVMEQGLYALLLLVLAAVLFVRQYRRSPALREKSEVLLLRLPVIGGILAKASLARWTRTFASLFSAGVPLAQILEAAAGASDSVRFRQALNGIRSDVAAGFPLAVALRNTGVYPAMMVQMTAVGEESGALDTMLGKVADYYEREMNETVARLSTLMEPAIMVLIGTLVGGIVIAMYMPIFNMGSVL